MNLGDLKERMGTWLGVNEVRLPDTQRGEIVNMIRRDLTRQLDIRWGETKTPISALVGVQTIDVPDDFLEPYLLYWEEDGSRHFVDFRTRERFLREFPENAPLTTDTGDPTVYTIWHSLIYLGPTPKRDLTLTFEYASLPPELTTDLGEGDMDKDVWEAILWGSLAYASKFLIEDERTPIWEAQYLQAKTDLAVQHARQRSVGAVSQSVEPH